jgi:hypothetical protein
MKIRDYLYTLAVLICGTAISSAGLLINPYRFGPSAPSYLVNQNFEATGYDPPETWTEALGTGGTVDEDYTTEALVGTQSLRMVEATGDVTTKITLPGGAVTGAWAYFVFQVDSFPGDSTSNRQIMRFGAGSPLLAGVLLDSISGTTFKLRAHNGSSTGTPSTDTFALGETIHVWCHADTITDTTEVWWSTTSTRSATGGSKYSTYTAGVTTTYTEAWLISDYPAAVLLFDKLLISTAEIGNAP